MAARSRHVLLQACPERLPWQAAEGARIYSPTLGRFLQTDPIGYEDQFNLYAYVANDPINGVDPSGLSYEIADRVATCQIDDRQSFLDAGYSDDQVDGLNQVYTNAVNRALSVGDGTVTVQVGDRSFETTGNEIAGGLAEAFVKFDEGTHRASMAGGQLSNGNSLASVAQRINDGELPYVLRIGSGMFRNEARNGTSIRHQQERTFIHEGLHTTKGEGVMAGLPRFMRVHQNGYGAAVDDVIRRGNITPRIFPDFGRPGL